MQFFDKEDRAELFDLCNRKSRRFSTDDCRKFMVSLPFNLHKSDQFCHLHGLIPPPCRRFSATLPEIFCHLAGAPCHKKLSQCKHWLSRYLSLFNDLHFSALTAGFYASDCLFQYLHINRF